MTLIFFELHLWNSLNECQFGALFNLFDCHLIKKCELNNSGYWRLECYTPLSYIIIKSLSSAKKHCERILFAIEFSYFNTYYAPMSFFKLFFRNWLKDRIFPAKGIFTKKSFCLIFTSRTFLFNYPAEKWQNSLITGLVGLLGYQILKVRNQIKET